MGKYEVELHLWSVDILNVQTTVSKTNFTPPPQVERRRSVRTEQGQIDGWLSDPTHGGVMSQQQRISVFDLSLHGVGFRCANPPEEAAAHWMVIANDKLHLSTRIRIVSARKRDDGLFDVGAEFF